jgi:hypothetical protein
VNSARAHKRSLGLHFKSVKEHSKPSVRENLAHFIVHHGQCWLGNGQAWGLGTGRGLWLRPPPGHPMPTVSRTGRALCACLQFLLKVLVHAVFVPPTPSVWELVRGGHFVIPYHLQILCIQRVSWQGLC